MTPLDALIVACYALAVLAIGAAVSRRDAGGEDFLVGGRRIPAWAALVSLIATELSAATFIGVPGAAYRSLAWTYLQFAIGSLLARLVLARVVIPLYHRERVRTVYEFIRSRYGEGAQLATAWTFLVGRLIASGVRLAIAGLAFGAMIGVDPRYVHYSIIGCGIVATVYSTSGGIRAIIWTDVLQFCLLVAGASSVVVAIHQWMPGGLGAAFDWAVSSDAFRVLSFPSPAEGAGLADRVRLLLGTSNAFFTALAGGFFLTLATHSTDHDMVQRLLTTRTGRKGGLALAGSGLVNFPVVALFLAIGTGLAALAAAGVFVPADPDQVVSEFVRERMGTPWRGLFFAGLFAVAMSSLDAPMCALSATWAVDIRGRARAREGSAADRALARTSRLGSVVFAALLILLALAFAEYRQRSGRDDNLVEFALSAMTMVFGGLLAVFAYPFVARRPASSAAAIVALAAGSALGAALFFQEEILGRTPIAWPWWIPITGAVSFAILAFSPRAAGSAAPAATDAGDRLWIGIPEARLDLADRAHLAAVSPGGVILFRRNIEDEAQVRALVAELRGLLGEDLLVVVDQEGGAVVRFEREATVFPGNLALGAIAATDRPRALDLARRQGRVSAAELGALGVDGNLAPVCDLTVRADNPGVGCRSFGGDPALAGDLAAELVRGHLEGGVFAVAKHFPGLGAADRDSHESLPRIGAGAGRDPDRDLARALDPFRRAIAAGVPAVMTAHLVHDALDPEHPATTSPRAVSEALRGRLGFAGATVSDDLGMGALAGLSIEEKVERALRAGHDILCVCHDPESQRRARARLDALGAGRDAAAAGRIAALRSTVGRLADGGAPPATPAEPGAPLAAEIAERALTVLRRGPAPVAIPAGERWLLILPAARDLTQVEDPLRGEDLVPLAERLADRTELLAVGSPPAPADIARAAARSADLDGIVIATIGLRRSEAERQLVLGCLEWQARTIVIPLGDPAELAALPARAFTAVTAYGYRRVHQEALARLLRGEIAAAGRYPGPPEVARAARFDP